MLEGVSLAVVEELCRGLGIGFAERVLGVLPFFHVFALTVVMNVSIASAAEIIIMPRFSLDEALKLETIAGQAPAGHARYRLPAGVTTLQLKAT